MSLLTIIGLAIKLSLMLTVFSYGIQAGLNDVLYLFRRPAQLVRAVLSISVIMPIFVGLLVAVFNFQPVVAVALVALAVSPVPPILPNKALKSGGGKSFTFGLLAAVSLLSIVTIPLSLKVFEFAFSHPTHFSESSIISALLTSVILPFTAG